VAQSLIAGDWARVTTQITTFSSSALDYRDVIHSPSCRARVEEDGAKLTGTRCTCTSGIATVESSTVVQVVEIRDEAALIDVIDQGLCWVEREGLKQCARPKKTAPAHTVPKTLSIPADLEHIEMHSFDKRGYRRRKKRPIGGDLIYLRDDLKLDAELAPPYRYLCQVHRQGTLCAVLLDPTLHRQQALYANWPQIKVVKLVEDKTLKPIERVLVPVYPLPDKTDSPGWR